MSAPERIYLSGSTAVTRDRLTEKGLATAIEYIRADAPELVRLRRIAELADLLIMDGVSNTMTIKVRADGSESVLHLDDDSECLYVQKCYLNKLQEAVDSLLAAQRTEASTPRKTEA